MWMASVIGGRLSLMREYSKFSRKLVSEQVQLVQLWQQARSARRRIGATGAKGVLWPRRVNPSRARAAGRRSRSTNTIIGHIATKAWCGRGCMCPLLHAVDVVCMRAASTPSGKSLKWRASRKGKPRTWPPPSAQVYRKTRLIDPEETRNSAHALTEIPPRFPNISLFCFQPPGEPHQYHSRSDKIKKLTFY